jgi:hypothetical protein
MAGLPLSSIFAIGTSVRAPGEPDVPHCSRRRGGGSGTGFRVAG